MKHRPGGGCLPGSRCLVGLALAVACTMLGGCMIAPIRDLRIEGAEVVPDAPSFFRQDGRVPGPWIVLRLRARDDPERYVRDHGVTAWSEMSLCTEGRFDSRRLLTDIWPDMPGYAPPVPRASGQESAGGAYAGLLYLKVRTRGWRPHASSDDRLYVDHDMREREGDVCLRLGGGNMTGRSHRTDTVVIPYALIAAALARAGLPHAPPAPPTDRP